MFGLVCYKKKTLDILPLRITTYDPESFDPTSPLIFVKEQTKQKKAILLQIAENEIDLRNAQDFALGLLAKNKSPTEIVMVNISFLLSN